MPRLTSTLDPTIDPAAAARVRLVVSDLDGSLLDGSGSVPDGFWAVLERMGERGIVFAPATGRQYAGLGPLLTSTPAGTTFICENGGYVVRDGAEVVRVVLDRPSVVSAVEGIRSAAHAGRDVGLVLTTGPCAYVERDDPAFLAAVGQYYAALEVVPDLLEVTDTPVKLAGYTPVRAEDDVLPALEHLAATHRVVVSSTNWVDVMPLEVDKGVAVRRLQRELGVLPSETVAFGDYLNDLEMLGAADLSFAMANAHPQVRAQANAVAPANHEHGVVTTLERLLDAADLAETATRA